MAKKKQKDLLSRFADAGEEAFQLLSSAPGADRVLGSALGVMHNMRDQMDSLSKRVRRVEALEQRVAKLERELAKTSRASGTKATTSRKTSPSKSSASRSTGGTRASSSRKKT